MKKGVQLTAFLGKDNKLEGTFTFHGTARIDGYFTGEISATGDLVVGEGGVVEGDIRASSVIIYGQIHGDITAEQKVEMHAPAQVFGDAHTPTLVMDEGVIFEGMTSMSQGEEPREAQAEGITKKPPECPEGPDLLPDPFDRIAIDERAEGSHGTLAIISDGAELSGDNALTALTEEGWELEIEPYEIPQWDQFSVVFSWKVAAVLGLLIAFLAVSHRGRETIGELFRLGRTGSQIASEMARVGPVTGQNAETRQRAHSVTRLHLKGQPFSDGPGEEGGGETGAIKRSDAGEDAFQRKVDAMSQSLTVEEGVICRAVYKMRPLLVGECFTASVGTLCCFTETTEAWSPTEITHVWYFGDSEKARVTLQVCHSGWSAYSSHRINPSELGAWHVAVLGPGGRLLQTLTFEITPEREKS